MTAPFVRDAPQFFVRIDTDAGAERCLTYNTPGVGDPNHDRATHVLSFEYHDRESKVDLVKFVIANNDLSHLDDPIWKKGQRIFVRWGYPGRMSPERAAIVTSVKGFQQLTVEAKAESILMNKIVRARLFEHTKRSEVVRQIARENGYSDDTMFVDDTEHVFESVSQARLTDAQFLQRLARLEGFEFYVDFDGLHWHRRQVEQRPVRRYVWSRDNFGELLSIHVDNDITGKPGRTRMRGRDPIEGADIDESAGTGDGGEAALAEIYEVIDPVTGQGSIEKRVQQEDTRPTSVSDAAAAAREARGRHLKHQQTAVKLRVTAIGDPIQLAKTVVQLDGVGKRLGVRYYVREVVHKVSNGYTMEMVWISDGHGGHDTTSKRVNGVELLEPGPPQRGRVNQQNANADDGEEIPALEAVEQIDPVTGEGRTVFRDASTSRTLTIREATKQVFYGERTFADTSGEEDS